MLTPLISIVIPTYNEAGNITTLIAQLQKQESITSEIIVADGGSKDSTLDIPKEAGLIIATSTKGRALQMNTGARLAKADTLLFLHADSSIEDPSLISKAVEAFDTTLDKLGHQRAAGHFTLQFTRTSDGNSRAYHYYEAKTKTNRPGTINGDQGLLIKKEYFLSLGGFDERLPFLEDQRLSTEIFKTGKWITLPGIIKTSARRFEQEGLARRMILAAIIMGLREIDFSPFFEHAAKIYRTHNESQRLIMSPFFKLIINLFRKLPIKKRLNVWVGIGRYVRQNAWQPFFFLDTLLGQHERSHPFLSFHDRVFKPLTDFYIFDLFTALLVYVWFSISAIYFYLQER